jgi:hypothetical protein
MTLNAERNNIKPMLHIITTVMMVVACCLAAVFACAACSPGEFSLGHSALDGLVRHFRLGIMGMPFLQGLSVLGVGIGILPSVPALRFFSVMFDSISVGGIFSVLPVLNALAFFAPGFSSVRFSSIHIEQIDRLNLTANSAFFFGHKKPPVDWQLTRLSRTWECRQEAGETIAGIFSTANIITS